MAQRIISIWLNRFASQRVLRRIAHQGVFVLTHVEKNAQRIYCLNGAGEKAGLVRGMSFADARAICPDLRSAVVDFIENTRFLAVLTRWAERYCPIVCVDGADGLLLDIGGAAHLFGGEEILLADLLMRLKRAGFSARAGLADSVGAAWALARFGNGEEIALRGQSLMFIQKFPVQALRLRGEVVASLKRLGIERIGQLAQMERIGLTRRLGKTVFEQLDRAVGTQTEILAVQKPVRNFAARLTLPEPIGLEKDIMGGLNRLLERVCEKLEGAHMGARALRLVVRRVDQHDQCVEIGMARPMRDAKRMGRLFERGISTIDAGFGIDQLYLMAMDVEPLVLTQLTYDQSREKDDLADLISRIGNRVGFENVQIYLPSDSHIPEKSFVVCPAAYSKPAKGWGGVYKRPLFMFAPEIITGNLSARSGAKVPSGFKWRRMWFETAKAQGPERIMAEWWLDDPNWRSGMRDYWFVQTSQGRRLWLFYTPQNPGWFVQGEFA